MVLKSISSSSCFAILSILMIGLSSCSKTIWHTADAKYIRYEVKEGDEKTHDISEIIAPYKNELEGKMSIVIGENEVELTKERVECSIGNWFCDIVLEEANRLSKDKVHIALQNYGGIRSNSLGAGPITVREIYEIMPFENRLVVVEVDGETLLKFFDQIADYGGWPVSKGVQFQISEGKAINVTLFDEAIDNKAIYRLAVSDYIANGGDDTNYFKTVPQFDYNILVRDVLINHIKRDTEMGVKQFGEKEGRITKLD